MMTKILSYIAALMVSLLITFSLLTFALPKEQPFFRNFLKNYSSKQINRINTQISDASVQNKTFGIGNEYDIDYTNITTLLHTIDTNGYGSYPLISPDKNEIYLSDNVPQIRQISKN